MELTRADCRLVFFSRHDQGGIAKRSRLIASGLADRGWKVYVIARAAHLRWLRISRTGNVTILEVPGLGMQRVATLLFLLCAVPVGAAVGVRASAFLAIKLFSPSTAAAICAVIARRPFVALATTSGSEGEVAYLLGEAASGATHLALRSWTMALRRHLLRKATFVVAQTPTAKQELLRLLPVERIRIVPTPVEAVSPPPLTNQPRVLFVGRLSRDKDLLRLLEAWRTVLAGHLDAHLTLVGEGGLHEPIEAELRSIVANDSVLRTAVTFAGWVSDVAPFLTDSDVFVFPSLPLQEGMSNALLEACAWGRVVVASDIPANRAVLGDDYPLLFAAGDVAALAEMLSRALDEEETRTEARARVIARSAAFSLEVVLDELEDVIRAAVDGRT